MRPPRRVFTSPVPGQERAVRRQRNLKNLRKDLDGEKLNKKLLIFSAWRKELKFNKGQAYGRCEVLPLVSKGCYHWNST